MLSSRLHTSALVITVLTLSSIAALPTTRATSSGAAIADTLFNRIAGPDAKISPQEFQAYIKELSVGSRAAGAAALAPRTFTRLDANGDASLDEKEFAAFGARRAGRGAAAGATGVGSDSAAGRGRVRAGRGAVVGGDTAAGRAGRAARTGRAGRAVGGADSARAGANTDSVFARVAGADGTVSRTEFEAYLRTTAIGGRIGGQPSLDRLWTRFDTNADGALGRGEFAAVITLTGGRGRGRDAVSDTLALHTKSGTASP